MDELKQTTVEQMEADSAKLKELAITAGATT